MAKLFYFRHRMVPDLGRDDKFSLYPLWIFFWYFFISSSNKHKEFWNEILIAPLKIKGSSEIYMCLVIKIFESCDSWKIWLILSSLFQYPSLNGKQNSRKKNYSGWTLLHSFPVTFLHPSFICLLILNWFDSLET